MKLSITFDVVTQESSMNGESSRSGFELDATECSDVADLLSDIERALGYLPHTEWCGSWFATIDAEQDLSTGADTFYNIHVEGATKAQLTEIAEALHCKI
jgi:hypothetical protein